MKLRANLRALAAAALLAGIGLPAAAQNAAHPGEAIYKARCASCHDNPAPETRAAALTAIQGLPAERLREVLTGSGVMAPMAAGLSAGDLGQLVGFLTKDQKPAAAAWDQAMMCAADQRKVDLSATPSLAMFNVDLAGSRRMSAAQAGLKTTDMANLELAWAVGFPRSNAMSATPVVVGSTVFANGGGKVLALDAAKGCAKWSYEAGASRSPLTYGEIGGRKVLIFSAGRGEIHVVDAATGQQVWKADGRPANGVGSIRSAVVLHKDKIIVPISASGVGSGMNPKFECCDGHGAVVALSARDGSRVWEYHTMPDATYNGQVNSLGVKQRGPSGAPIWSTPTIDVKRNRVLVTSGENTSHPATDTSDAIIALDFDTGRPAWVFQAMAADVWNMACDSSTPHAPGAENLPVRKGDGPNCPIHFGGQGRDFDFGGSAIVARTKGGLFGGGKDVVLAGQKSGHLWALDAETGKVLWSRQVGHGTALGGNHWGIAVDGERAFLTINDPPRLLTAPLEAKPGVYAFDIKTGKPVWSYEAKADCEGEKGKLVMACTDMFGFSATPLVVDGALIAGTLAGKLYAFDAKTGKVLKLIETVGPVQTVNGVDGKGGSIDSHAIAAGGGMVLVGSGYGSFGQTPGNVLMAFRPKAK
jgi:polyvinyl alcohol dehydrogenase (cytochrome)